MSQHRSATFIQNAKEQGVLIEETEKDKDIVYVPITIPKDIKYYRNVEHAQEAAMNRQVIWNKKEKWDI